MTMPPRHRRTGPSEASRASTWRIRALMVILVVEGMLAIGVIAWSGPPAGGTLAAMYEPPAPLRAADPGRPVRVWKLAAPAVHGTVYGLLYHSRSVTGKDVAVSGYLAVPDATDAPAVPTGGRPIVTLGHGTVGMADQCAPSRDPGADAATINPFLAQGWIVVSTDFEGIGTPGRHPYLVGTSEARSMIDAVRAARDLLGRAASSTFVAWGISQGGHAALFTRQVAQAWAPELHLAGAVAMAPVSDLASFVTTPTIVPQAVTLEVAAGFAAAYPDLRPQQVLTPLGLRRLDDVDHYCVAPLNLRIAAVAVARLRRTALTQVPDWERAVQANTPGLVPSDVPVLVVQGTRDPIVPQATSQALFRRLCAGGAPATLDLVDNGSHADVIESARSTYLGWMADRLAGRADRSGCPSTS